MANTKCNTDIAKQSEFFKALGHPTRLLIVRKLANGPTCVKDFVTDTGLDFSTISKHLAVLRHSNIVTDNKAGKQIFYCLVCPEVINLLDLLYTKQAASESNMT